ncbi:MAG: outer membrane protein assembly factor BamD [bacterium]
MKKLVIFLLALVALTNCSSSVDTSLLTPDQYLEYAMSLFDNEDYEQCITEFQAILLQYPGNAVNDDAQFFLGMTYFKRDQFLLAAYEYSKLIKGIPASPFVPQAQFMLAECYYQLSPKYPLDQAYTKKSIEEFQAFIDFFPKDEKLADAEAKIRELREKLALKEYNSSMIYEKMEYYTAAIKYYQVVFENYHDTKYAPMALYKKIKLLVFRNKIGEAMSDMATFLSRYPDDENAQEIQTLEESFNK